MKDLRLINILKTFSKDEMKLFGKFVASPYHNRGKNCALLFKLLQKAHPDFKKSGDFTFESIHRKLYPSRKFNKQVTWNLTSAMEKMAREFLKQRALEKDKFAGLGLMLTEYGNRKLLNNYSQTISEMEKLLQTRGIDYYYFRDKSRLELYKQEYYQMADKIQAMGDSNIKATESQIMTFLRMTVGGLRDLHILEEYHNYRYNVNLPLEVIKKLDLESIVDYANNNNFEYAYLIELYYHSLMMLLEPKQTWHLDKFRELYGEHYKKLEMREQSNMILWIINYCLYNLEQDEEKYKRIVFELNEFRLREGMAFYPENQLSKAIYLQILTTALDVNETEWAGNFIKEYTAKLLPDNQESIRCMAYAFLYFHTKEYVKVLKNLNKVAFIDIRDNLQTRVLSAKSYYELNEIEALLHNIDSSKHFIIENTSVSEIVRKHVHNFFKYLRKLAFIKENKDIDKISILRNEIEKVVEISGKKWLLEKLDELERV